MRPYFSLLEKNLDASKCDNGVVGTFHLAWRPSLKVAICQVLQGIYIIAFSLGTKGSLSYTSPKVLHTLSRTCKPHGMRRGPLRARRVKALDTT